MKKIHRQLILVLAILLFIIAAPVLVFFAMGYRFDFKNFEPIKVGMLIIESEPQSVDIYLNNRLEAKRTPAKISSLTPGNYKIKIQKDGFYTWKKTLRILSGRVNWASHVRLFYEKPNLTNLAENNKFSEVAYSSDQSIAYLISNYAENRGVFKYNFGNNQLAKIFPKNDQENNYQQANFADLRLSVDGDYVFFNLENLGMKDYIIANETKDLSLNTLFGYEINNPIWSEKYNYIIYWLYNNNLYSFNTDTAAVPTVVSSGVFSFGLNDNYAYLEKFEKNKYVLKRARENSLSTEEKIINSPENQEIIEIKPNPNNDLAFRTKNNSLYILRKEQNKLKAAKIFDSVKNYIWSKKENKLLYFNDNEIWFYELINNKNKIPLIHNEYEVNNANLIIRIGDTIQKANWFPDEEHILYSSMNKLYAIELDERNNKNSVVWDTFEIIDFEVDKKGENAILLDLNNLFLEARISEDDGLF